MEQTVPRQLAKYPENENTFGHVQDSIAVSHHESEQILWKTLRVVRPQKKKKSQNLRKPEANVAA